MAGSENPSPEDVTLFSTDEEKWNGHLTMNATDRITLDPAVCHGKPCIRGLRYPVENLLELLAGGMTIEQILADYEDLDREDILAALSYTASLSRVKRIERLAV